MSLNAIRENKILAKVSESTVDFFPSGKCPPGDGYLHFREINGCYKPQPDQSGDYSDAADVCEKEGAYLVKFNNLNEKNSLRNMLLASSCMYIFSRLMNA